MNPVKTLMLGIALAICLWTAINAKAQTQVLGFNYNFSPAPTHMGMQATYGFQFQVTTPLTVTGLAAYDPNAPAGIPLAPYFTNFDHNVAVQLWTETQTLVAQVVITNGTLPMAGTSYCVTPITPVVLQPGTYRIDSDSYFPYAYGSFFPGYASVPGCTYLDACYDSAPLGSQLAFGYPDYLNVGPKLPFALSANIVVALPPPTPVITSDGNLTTVYWPAAAGNFTLQTTTDLGNTNWTAISTNWMTVLNSTAFVGATVTNTTPQAFFRLLQSQ